MKKPNQRIGADIVKTDLVELHQSSSNKSATYALHFDTCLLYTSPSPRDRQKSRMPSYA